MVYQVYVLFLAYQFNLLFLTYSNMANTTYPAKIDTSTSLPLSVDTQTAMSGVYTNNAIKAIIAVEGELGVKPSGTYSTVRARLDFLQTTLAGLQSIDLAGDIGGTFDIPKIIGLQGRPLSSVAPTAGQVLTWNGSSWIPAASTGGGGAISLGGDLAGTLTSQIVVGLQSRPMTSTAPSTGQAVVWSGSHWAPANISQDFILPAYLITIAGGGFAEVGQTINTPPFTATYNGTPITAVLSDSDGNTPVSVIGSPTLFHSNYNFTKNSFGATEVFTLTSSNGSVTKTATTTETWAQKVYFGVGVAGGSSAAFIQALAGSAITLSRAQTFTVTAGSTQKIYYAYRSAYGAATFTVGGFSGGFGLTSTTISVTNNFGFTENYTLYESDNLGLSTTTVTVS